MKLPVVVRRMRASKELIALFVTRPATDDPAMCWGYTMNMSLTAVDPNHVMRATDGVGTRDAQGFVSKNITASLYSEMGLIGRVQFEIHQRDRREENLATRKTALVSALLLPSKEFIEAHKKMTNKIGEAFSKAKEQGNERLSCWP